MLYLSTRQMKSEKKKRAKERRMNVGSSSAHILFIHCTYFHFLVTNCLRWIASDQEHSSLVRFFCLVCLCFSGFRVYFDEKNCVGSDRYQRRDTPKRKSSAAATMKKTQRKEQHKEHKERIQKGKNLLWASPSPRFSSVHRFASRNLNNLRLKSELQRFESIQMALVCKWAVCYCSKRTNNISVVCRCRIARVSAPHFLLVSLFEKYIRRTTIYMLFFLSCAYFFAPRCRFCFSLLKICEHIL